MSDINDIFERLKGQKPVISNPDELTDFIMDSLPDISEATEPTGARVVKMRWWATIAASLLIIIGIGTIWMFDNEQTELQLIATSDATVAELKTAIQEVGSQQNSVVVNNPRPTQEAITAIRTQKLAQDTLQQASEIHVNKPQPVQILHYASNIIQEDTIAYQDPARMDEFIAKLAEFNKVYPLPINCSSDLGDSIGVSIAYVFEDKPRFDLFARLLQAACWYDTKTPGYLLNFSRRQFFFSLKDMYKGEKYIWIMEQLMDGRILIFSTHSPIEAPASLICYQKLLEQLTNTDNIISQF